MVAQKIRPGHGLNQGRPDVTLAPLDVLFHLGNAGKHESGGLGGVSALKDNLRVGMAVEIGNEVFENIRG